MYGAVSVHVLIWWMSCRRILALTSYVFVLTSSAMPPLYTLLFPFCFFPSVLYSVYPSCRIYPGVSVLFKCVSVRTKISISLICRIYSFMFSHFSGVSPAILMSPTFNFRVAASKFSCCAFFESVLFALR
jgi:hypothetical protein